MRPYLTDAPNSGLMGFYKSYITMAVQACNQKNPDDGKIEPSCLFKKERGRQRQRQRDEGETN